MSTITPIAPDNPRNSARGLPPPASRLSPLETKAGERSAIHRAATSLDLSAKRRRQSQRQSQIPVDQLLTEEERADGAGGEKRPERNTLAPIAAAEENHRDADDGTGKRPEQQGDRYSAPTEKRADHRQELDVSAAHALTIGEPIVPLGDDPQEAATKQDA